MSIDPDAAATRIQARFRGSKSRAQRQKAVAGITRLQAQQRGRYSRREYAQLLQFYREQTSFLHETKRRQIRIWRNEQELFFLQHTTADQLEKIRDFQRMRSASAIQRAWRVAFPGQGEPRAACRAKELPIDRIYSFDPFQLGGFDSNKSENSRMDARPEVLRGADLVASLMSPLPLSPRVPPSIAEKDAFAHRRKNVQDRSNSFVLAVERCRIKQILHARKEKAKLAAAPPVSNDRSSFEKQNRRRDLYGELVQLRADTTRRVIQYERNYRATRSSRELLSAKLVSSCENRLQELQADLSTLPMLDKSALANPEQIQVQTSTFHASTSQWDPPRREMAWRHHTALVQSILTKEKWWQTQLAGTDRDIRKVYAKSPWENEKKVWMWPRDALHTGGCTDGNDGSNRIDGAQENDADPLNAFVFSVRDGDPGLADQSMRTPEPVDDKTASEWWRAHCMQRHLPIHEVDANNHESNNDDYRANWPPEALANPVFYRLYLQSQQQNRAKEHENAIETMCDRLQKQVNQRVGEIEMQIEVNTKLQQDLELRRQQVKKRRTREENAVISIQRTYRGSRGRKHAKEVRAEYFVMVRGRAIRKGKCEECGEQHAVLECQECEDSLHFCPVCWVQVHSTRRRKTHVAIPMAAATSRLAPLHARRHFAGEEPEAPVVRPSNPKSALGRRKAATAIAGATPPVLDKQPTSTLPSRQAPPSSSADANQPNAGVETDLLVFAESSSGDCSSPPGTEGDMTIEPTQSAAEPPAGGGTLRASTDTKNAAKAIRQKSGTPTNAAKPLASRMSLKQRMGSISSKSDNTAEAIRGSETTLDAMESEQSTSGSAVDENASASKPANAPTRVQQQMESSVIGAVTGDENPEPTLQMDAAVVNLRTTDEGEECSAPPSAAQHSHPDPSASSPETAPLVEQPSNTSMDSQEQEMPREDEPNSDQ